MRPRRTAAGGLLVVLTIVAVAGGAGLGVLVAGLVGGASGPGATDGTAAATENAAPSATPTARPTPTPMPTPEPTPVHVPAPLTGLPVTEAAAAQPVLAVMVDDHPDARPQAGFSAASVVWQAPAEGGTPRYMLFFQETYPALVGPIRSARGYFIDWAAEWRAIYVHAGGSPQALEMLRQSGRGQLVYNVEGLRWDGVAMFREHDGRFSPHNLFADGSGLAQMAAAVGGGTAPGSGVWRFGPDAPLDARPIGGSIRIDYPYNTVTYAYDAGTNTYRRSVEVEGRQADASTGTPVAPKNVVVLRMRFGALNDGHPEKHRLEAQDIGSGDAWIATNGRTILGRWTKERTDAPTLLYGPDGEPVTLTAGQTFVQVIPLSYEFSIEDGHAGAPREIPRSGGGRA